ncbi:MAG: hypothetical protein WCE45_05265 [Sedimentisphaerales bacterium]
MELTWTMRLRILASLAIGVVLLGLLPAGLVKPPADGIFAVLSGSISIGDLLICACLAFIAGFLASAISTPFGARIGILAAPAGLAVWALQSAPLSAIFQMAPAAQDRMAVYSKLKFEGFLWLAIVICGFCGAILADKIIRRKDIESVDEAKPVFPMPRFARIAISVIGTVFIANFLINVLAGGIGYPDPKVAHVTAQPANLQIAFAVFIAFGVCGFLAKVLLGSRAFWPAAASAALISYSATIYEKSNPLTYLSASWPANFFIKPVTAVLPVQMVAFACLGAVWGYWLAVDYNWWRTHQA